MSDHKTSRIANSVMTRAEEVVREDAKQVRMLMADAARSGSYMYPFKGIFYYATHRSLWTPLMTKIVPYIVLSGSVTAGMFFFTYMPQLAVLLLVNGPLAMITTPLLILSESSTIVNFVGRNFLLQDVLLDTFDATLVSRNSIDLLERGGRELKTGSDPVRRLGRLVKKPSWGREQIGLKALVRYLIYLPLNFIPVVGTAFFLYTQATGRGKIAHGRYFDLRGFSQKETEEWLTKYRGPYTAFGLVASLLEAIPFVGVLFTFANTVGAALWAVDMERFRQKHREQDNTKPGEQNSTKLGEQEYSNQYEALHQTEKL